MRQNNVRQVFKLWPRQQAIANARIRNLSKTDGLGKIVLVSDIIGTIFFSLNSPNQKEDIRDRFAYWSTNAILAQRRGTIEP